MTAPLQLKPEEVEELTAIVVPSTNTPSFPGCSEWIELRRSRISALISDWRTLTAEREEMRKEIERLRNTNRRRECE